LLLVAVAVAVMLVAVGVDWDGKTISQFLPVVHIPSKQVMPVMVIQTFVTDIIEI
jgi:hypothetical protein